MTNYLAQKLTESLHFIDAACKEVAGLTAQATIALHAKDLDAAHRFAIEIKRKAFSIVQVAEHLDHIIDRDADMAQIEEGDLEVATEVYGGAVHA